MKTYALAFLFAVATFQCFSQFDNWKNFTNADLINFIIPDGNHVWIGGQGSGLIKYNIENQEKMIYTSSNGVLSNFHICASIEESGEIWLGSYYGLSRYKDEEWVKRPGGYSKGIYALETDQEGKVYIASISNYIGVFDGSEWMYYNSSNSAITGTVRDILFTDENVLYAATSQGLVKFDGSDWQVFNTDNSGLPENDIRGLNIDSDGNLWIINHNLTKFDQNDEWTVYNKNNSPLVTWGLYDLYCKNDVVWIASDSGLYSFDNMNWERFYPGNCGIASSWCKTVAIDEDNSIWVGHWKEGISYYDGQNWQNLNFSNNGLSSGFVGDIRYFENGYAYLDCDGLTITDTYNWENYNHTNSIIPYFGLTDMDIDSEGNCWFGGKRDLFYFDGENIIDYTNTAPEFLDEYTEFIKADQYGRAWVNGVGVGCFDGANWRFYTKENSGISRNSVKSMDIGLDGSYWFGAGSGISVLNNDSTWERYDQQNTNLPGKDLTSLEIDSQGIVWLAAEETGLVKFDQGEVSIYNEMNSGLPDNDISCIRIDKNDKLWIGTDVGMASFDGVNWEIFDVVNSGIPGNHILSIDVDEYNNKWISTNYNGFSLFNENGITGTEEILFEPKENLRSNVYPNPADKFVWISFNLPIPAYVSISIYDQNGKICKTHNTDKLTKGLQEVPIETETFTPGMYTYLVSHPGFKSSGKFIIQ